MDASQVEAAVTTLLPQSATPESRRAADTYLSQIAASPAGCEVAFSVRSVSPSLSSSQRASPPPPHRVRTGRRPSAGRSPIANFGCLKAGARQFQNP